MFEETPFPWQETFEAVLRRSRLVVAVALAGSLLVAALLWLRPPVYRAKATILLAAQRISGPRVDAMPDKQIESELALLASPELIRSVLEEQLPRRRRIAPASGPLSGLYRRFHGLPARDPLDERVRAVAETIETNRIAETNLVEVAYRSGSPRWAATLVNALLNQHVERIARLNEQTDARGFFQRQGEVISRRLQTARAALQRFRAQQGADFVTMNESDLRKSLAELDTERSAAATTLEEVRARVGYLEGEIGRHPATIAAESEVRQNESARLLQDRIVQLEVQRSELLSKYAPTSTVIVDLERQIALAKRLLAGKQLESNASTKTAINPAHQALELDLVQKRAEAAALAARVGALAAREATLHRQLASSGSAGLELVQLEDEVKSANEAYLEYLRRAEEARLAHALDRSGIVNISVLERAQVPSSPEPSKAGLWLLAGALASLAAGVAAGLVRDRLDPAVKSGTEAERLTGLPVLGEVPG
jgi:uncharacterized protein involved in exopolysaccharide biosynthesis